MKKNTDIKVQILKQMQHLLASKIDDARQTIASAKESRNNDTKSSAGDKFETGRAMIQMEIDNNEIQLDKALKQQEELSKIDIKRQNEKVAPGSLVITNHETYFISIAMGKIIVDGNPFYAISLVSPIGMLLKNKAAGENAEFQGRKLVIKVIA
jgi:hypothetical protein